MRATVWCIHVVEARASGADGTSVSETLMQTDPTAFSKGRLLSPAPNRSAGFGGNRHQYVVRAATVERTLTRAGRIPAILRAERRNRVPLRCGNCWSPRRALGSRTSP